MKEATKALAIVFIVSGFIFIFCDIIARWKKTPPELGLVQRLTYIIKMIGDDYGYSLSLIGLLMMLAGFLGGRLCGLVLIILGLYIVINELGHIVKEFRRKSQENKEKKRIRRILSLISELMDGLDAFLGLGLIMFVLGCAWVFIT